LGDALPAFFPETSGGNLAVSRGNIVIVDVDFVGKLVKDAIEESSFLSKLSFHVDVFLVDSVFKAVLELLDIFGGKLESLASGSKHRG
jgi:hypothetical protein